MKRIQRFTLLAPVFVLTLALCGTALAQQSDPTTPPSNSSAQTTPPATANQKDATSALPAAPGAQPAQAQPPMGPQPTGPTAVFDTTMGRMVCRLYSKLAPKTVANFIGLATGTKDWTNPATGKLMHGVSLYNGTIFHRVIPGFMIQGGDPLGTGMGGPGYQFADEFNPDLNFNVAGRLAMANDGPNTNGSQFFITVSPQPHLDQGYTIFGQCTPDSVIVAESITEVPRDANNKPLEPVTLTKLTIVPVGQPLPPTPAIDRIPAAPTPAPATPPIPETPPSN